LVDSRWLVVEVVWCEEKVAMILPWYGAKPWYWPLFEASAGRIGMDVIVVAEKGR